MQAQPLKTVKEVVMALAAYAPSARVQGTWEGIKRDVRVYRAANGVVIIDVDDGDYQTVLQCRGCTDCGKRADGFHEGLPYCYDCWANYEEAP